MGDREPHSDAAAVRICLSVIERVVAGGEDPARVAPDCLVARVAARQAGAVSWLQLRTLGVGRGGIESRVRRGLLHPLHMGVYLWGHPSPTPLARAHAAVLACGDGTLVSGDWAAATWGVRPPTFEPVEVTVIGRRVQRQGIRTHQTASLDRADVRRRHGLPITAPARTLIDIAADLSPKDLADALEQAQIKRLVTHSDIEGALARAPGRPGTRVLRSLAAEPAFTRSKAERKLLALMRAAKLPAPELNTVAEGHEVDVLWQAERVTLEFDSYAFHATRAAFERDRARDIVLTRARYTPLRTTWRELTTESHALVARIAHALATN